MTRERRIREALVAMKPQVLASIDGATPGPLFDACFDYTVSHVVWNVYDGYRTLEKVLPYLTVKTRDAWGDPSLFMDLRLRAAGLA